MKKPNLKFNLTKKSALALRVSIPLYLCGLFVAWTWGDIWRTITTLLWYLAGFFLFLLMVISAVATLFLVRQIGQKKYADIHAMASASVSITSFFIICNLFYG